MKLLNHHYLCEVHDLDLFIHFLVIGDHWVLILVACGPK